jgi:type I restriction-modification system DNA methylase subunit
MKDEIYYFHQTPKELCEKLIQFVPLELGDKVYEPFKGEGGFYNSYPDFVEKDWSEIEEGRDFFNYEGEYDWVVSNPPFKLENKTGVRENAFFKILKNLCEKAKKGIAFLGNDYCFSTLTPIRLKEINEKGFYLNKIVVCNVKKWRGRYFFIIFEKKNAGLYHYIEGNY